MTGLPVRAAFERVRSLRAPAPGERLRVLVTSGGFGVGPIARVVESFAGIDGVELVVVCGRATKLVERVTRVAAEAGVRARVVGFERNMAARVGEAHVVVGKAGGLTISEAMTAGRPLAIVAAVPGNESLNEEFVVDGGGELRPRRTMSERRSRRFTRRVLSWRWGGERRASSCAPPRSGSSSWAML